MKSLFANISLVVLLNILVKPAWLLVEMKVQDVIGHEEWATYAALLSLGFLFITLSDLGINQYATKTLASERGEGETLFGDLLGIKLVLTAIYPVFMLAVGWALRYTWPELQLLFWLCLIQGGNQMMMFFRARFQAAQRFKMDGWLSVVDRVALLLIVGALFLTRLDMGRFVMARLAAVGLSILLMYVLSIPLFGWTRPRVQRTEMKRILKLSMSFALMTILYSIHDKIDQVMLERMYPDPKANGLYVAAYRWLDAFSMYLWTVLPIFFARFAYYLQNLREQEKLLHFGQVIAALPMIFVGGFVLTYGDLLLFPYAKSSAAELATIHACMTWLFVAALFNGVFAVFSTLLTATGHESFINKLVLASILLNVILNIFLIPQYGALACAWSTLASYAFMDLAYVIYVQRNIDMKVPYLQMAKIGLASGVMVLVFWVGTSIEAPWWVVSSLAGGSLLLAARLLRLISMAKLKALRV